MKAIVYSKEHCGYCKLAKKHLQDNGIEFDVFLVGQDVTKEELAEVVKKPVEGLTVPQIFINDEYVGGYSELIERDLSITV